MRVKFSGGSVEPRGEISTGSQSGEPLSNAQPAPPVAAVPAAPSPLGHEEVLRIQVEPEDRLAFRVGVNILTLVLVGLAVYLVWRRFFAGG